MSKADDLCAAFDERWGTQVEVHIVVGDGNYENEHLDYVDRLLRHALKTGVNSWGETREDWQPGQFDAFCNAGLVLIAAIRAIPEGER